MLSYLFRPCSFISEEQLCPRNHCRTKMITVGTYPGDCCPWKQLISSVQDFLPLAPSWQGFCSPLGHQGHCPWDWERLWSWGQWWRSKEHLAKDELVDKVPVTPACPERLMRCRVVAPWLGEVGKLWDGYRQNCNARKQGQNVPELLWPPGDPLLEKGRQVWWALCHSIIGHIPPSRYTGVKAPGKILQNGLTPTTVFFSMTFQGGEVETEVLIYFPSCKAASGEVQTRH